MRQLLKAVCRTSARWRVWLGDFGRCDRSAVERIVQHAIVKGRADCPDGGEAGEEYRARWLRWVSHFDPLEQAVLADASVGVEHPDLRLGFESGHWVVTFSNGGPGRWWYYIDREADQVFEAGAAGIVRKPAEQS